MKRLMDSALEYIKNGFPVFPCCWPTIDGKCGCGKKHPDNNAGKAPLMDHGLNDATITQTGVKEYWTRWPKANIGLAIPKGYFVLDVDIDKQGYESLGTLQERHGQLTETLMITTGSFGQHHWYKTPRIIKNTVRLDGLNGLDIRGEGGYVIAPPSLHKCGRYYVVAIEAPIIQAPDWLIEVCTKREPVPVNSNPSNPIPEGSRNDTLARDAGAMRRRGLSEEAIFAALKIENLERCQPPLLEVEVMNIAKSVGRYAPSIQQPISIDQKFRRGVVI